jgi:adenine phosphoribosyltransferase
MELRDLIRDVPGFPQPGIIFRDITPLLGDRDALREAVRLMSSRWKGHGVEMVAATESRGFIFGTAMAVELGAGFIPVRKAGRLPWKTRSVEYTLEYRSDVLHIHEDALDRGRRVLVVDDLIATGGTARAVVDLVRELGGIVVGVGVLIELSELKGRDRLRGLEFHSEIVF